MDQLKKRGDGTVTWIRLSSVNNTIGLALLREFDCLLEECEALPDSKALIIYGTGERFFSPGLNLYEVSQLDRAGMSDLMQAFSSLYLKLFTYPKPVLAMLNGDALAGGFLLASCCDFRYGRRGIKVGLTSLSRSVTMPFGSLKILEYLIGFGSTRQLTDQGQCLTAEGAFQIGWLDGIFGADDLEMSVRLRAYDCARRTSESLRRNRQDERSRLVEQIRSDEGRHLEEFLNGWFSQEAQFQIKEMVRALNDRTNDVGKEKGKAVEER